MQNPQIENRQNSRHCLGDQSCQSLLITSQNSAGPSAYCTVCASEQDSHRELRQRKHFRLGCLTLKATVKGHGAFRHSSVFPRVGPPGPAARRSSVRPSSKAQLKAGLRSCRWTPDQKASFSLVLRGLLALRSNSVLTSNSQIRRCRTFSLCRP